MGLPARPRMVRHREWLADQVQEMVTPAILEHSLVKDHPPGAGLEDLGPCLLVRGGQDMGEPDMLSFLPLQRSRGPAKLVPWFGAVQGHALVRRALRRPAVNSGHRLVRGMRARGCWRRLSGQGFATSLHSPVMTGRVYKKRTILITTHCPHSHPRCPAWGRWPVIQRPRCPSWSSRRAGSWWCTTSPPGSPCRSPCRSRCLPGSVPGE